MCESIFRHLIKPVPASLILLMFTQAFFENAHMRTCAQSEQQEEILTAGKSIQRELDGSEVQAYRMPLAAGSYLRAVVEQRGINVVLSLYGPDEKKICDLDSPSGAQGPEPVSLVAEMAGNYRLEIRALQRTSPKGQYELRVEEIRPATREDRMRVAAERGFAEATLIEGQGTAEALRKGIEKYLETVTLWQELGDRRQEAYVLTAIGHSLSQLGEYQQALAYHTRALPLKRAANDRSGEALTLYNIGAVQDHLGEPRRALEFYAQALAIQQSLEDHSMEASTLGNMGVVYSGLGDQHRALELFHRSLQIKRKIKDPYGEATLLNNIGLVNDYLGENQKALEFYQRARALYQALNDRAGEGTVLNNIATLYGNLGQHRTSLEFLEQVLQIKYVAGNRNAQAITLSNIGFAYGNLGEPRKALDYYNQSLALSRGMLRSSEATTLGNLGKVYADLGDYQKAVDYYNQSIALKREIGDRRGEAGTLNNLGRAWYDLHDPERALGYYRQALPIRQAVSDRGGEAITRYNMALAHRALNRLGEARTEIEAALAILESLRTKVASRSLRTSYLASTQKYYELGIDLLMRLHKQQPTAGYAAAALHLSEGARARGLLDLLAEIRADLRQGASPALLERERLLQQALDAKAMAQARLLAGKYTAEQAAAIAREINALVTEYEQLQSQIRSTSPRYTSLSQPAPIGLAEIQASILDPNSLLLEYSLGEETSYLWAVTRDSMTCFELPKRTDIESVARQAYEALIARSQAIPKETPEQRRRRIDRAEAEYPKAAAALSRMLIGPVASEMTDKRLLIVADGVLQYLPFGALPIPESENPLILENEIINLPSASVAALLRREIADRMPADKMLAVLADPVFSKDDPRVTPASKASTRMVDVGAPADGVDMPDLGRLRFSRVEAEEIVRLVAEEKKLQAMDFSASRALATSDQIGEYRVLHFATHGLLNSEHPELSSIALSMVDPQGRGQNGMLRLYDIFNLRLRADLVVLSACRTALGKEVKGEGLVGLTRGFMYAGAPRVVASLWRVDDRASAELMKRFYQEMLGRGHSPAAALRAAQISMWKEKRWQAPHYWAAFVFLGEWLDEAREAGRGKS